MKRLRLLPFLLSALILTATIGGFFLARGGRGRGERFPAPAGLGAAFRLAADSGRSAPAAAEEAKPAGDALASRFASTRLIRTASLVLEVTRYGEAAEKARALAVDQGGYLADAQSSREAGGHERGVLTLRVRADRFDQALHALEKLGRVESASVQTQDVGKEYFDLETRLSAKRDAEARLREILRTRTARLSDVLETEKELARVTEERERLEGERLFYDRQLALSTLTVELHEPVPFLRENALSPLREALGRALPLLSASAAALLYAIAAALPWVLVGLVIWRLRRRFATRRLIRIAMGS